MQHIVAERWSDAVSACSSAIEELTSCGGRAADKAIVYCNRAVAQYGLELYRRSVKDCDAAIQLDGVCLRAYLTKGMALQRMSKKKKALQSWRQGVDAANNAADTCNVDMVVLLQLQSSLGSTVPCAVAPLCSLSVRQPNASPVPVSELAAPKPTTAPAPPTAPPKSQQSKTNTHKKPSSSAATTTASADPVVEHVSAAPDKLPSWSIEARRQRAPASVTCAPSPHSVSNAQLSALLQTQGIAGGSGILQVDERIARGYLFVNTERHTEAIDAFTSIIQEHPNVCAPYLGRGSSYAFLGQLRPALADFTKAIELDGSLADAYKRRAQVLVAMGRHSSAKEDFTEAMRISGESHDDADTVYQMAMLLQKQKDFKAALEKFNKVVEMKEDHCMAWNFVGLCRNNIGQHEYACEAYDKCLALKPSFKEAWINKGQAWRELGQGDKALMCFTEAVKLDSTYVHTYHLRGLCFHGLGRTREALQDFHDGLLYTPDDANCRKMAGLVCHALGLYCEATLHYSQLINADPTDTAWYNRESALYCSNNIDRQVWTEYSWDHELSMYFKEQWCKSADPRTQLLQHGPKRYKPLVGKRFDDEDYSKGNVALEKTPATADVARILTFTASFEPLIQLNSPGFISNKRQHRMFGLSVVHMAQQIRKHWDSLRTTGEPLLVSNAGASRGGASRSGTHPMDFRDLFDIVAKWRQISEPNDPVWWIDRLATEAFEEGFGLQTPIVAGQNEVARYYPYFPMAFRILKELVVEQCSLTKSQSARLAAATDCADVHNMMQRDFWVVTPCHSSVAEGRIMEGTRLTIVAHHPNGYEFTIRTPGTPERWVQYEEELSAVWNRACAAAVDENTTRQQMLDIALDGFFYWVNFGPLTRGSAACGYAFLHALLLAFDVRIAASVPTGVQMDWEAILRPTPTSFREVAHRWMLPALQECSDIITSVPDISKTLPTLRAAVAALNVTSINGDDPFA